MEEKQFKKSKIKSKIIVAILLSVLCLFAGLIALIYFFNSKSLEQERINKIKIITQSCVNKVTNDFLWHCKDAEGFNMLLSNFNDISLSYREKYFSDLTKKFLINEPKASCFWAYLDSKDSNFINTILLDNPNANIQFFNNRKTFDVSWYRTGKEDIDVETFWLFEEAMEEDYFTLPILEKRPYVSSPYEYVYDYDNEAMPDSLKKKAWLLTFSTPVFDANNNVIGVTGMDINLHSTVDYIGSIYLFENIRFALITDSAKYLYNPNDEIIGKTVLDNPMYKREDAEFILQSILSNDEFEYSFRNTENNNVFVTYSLIYLPEVKLKMTLGIIIPYTFIKQTSQQLIHHLIFIFMIGFLLIAILVIGLSTRFDDEYLSNKIAKQPIG